MATGYAIIAVAGIAIAPVQSNALVRRGVGTIYMTFTRPVEESHSPSASQMQASEISGIRAELAQLAAVKRREFETSGELTAAKQAAALKWAGYRAASEASLKLLRDSDQYKAVRVQIVHLKTESAAQTEDASKRFELATISSELLSARSDLRKMEADHLAADEAVTAARYDAVDAAGRLTAIRRDFENRFRDNSEFRATRERLNAARNRMIADAHR